MENELKKIGFTKNESRVFLALIKLGECTIGPIEKEVGLFRQSLYNVLHHLADKGFVKIEKRNNRQIFIADDPDIILDQINTKQRLFERMLPDLHAMRGTKKYISDIKLYSGVKAFQLFHGKMLKNSLQNSEVCVLGAGGDAFLEIMRQGVFFDRYENTRINKKISHKLLMYENQRNILPDYNQRRYVEMRFLPEIFHQPIATQIWPDRVAITLFGTNPEIVEVKSEKITNGFKSYFDILWKVAKS